MCPEAVELITLHARKILRYRFCLHYKYISCVWFFYVILLQYVCAYFNLYLFVYVGVFSFNNIDHTALNKSHFGICLIHVALLDVAAIWNIH